MASTTSLAPLDKGEGSGTTTSQRLPRKAPLAGTPWLGFQPNSDDTPQTKYLDKGRYCGVKPRDPTHSPEPMSRLVMTQPRHSRVGSMNRHASFDQRSQKECVPATVPGGFRRGPRASPSKGMIEVA